MNILVDLYKRKTILAQRKKDIICLLAIFAFSVLPFWSFVEPGIINPIDTGFPINIEHEFLQRFSVWDNNSNFGSDVSGFRPNEIPYMIPLYMLSNLFSLEIVQRIWFISIFFMGGLSTYFFTKYLVKSKYSIVAGFVAAIFFMYNPMQVQFLVQGISQFHFALYLFPLSLLFFIKGFPSNNDKEDSLFKNVIIFTLIFSFTQVTVDIQNRIMIMYPYLLYSVWRLITGNKKKKDVMFVLIAFGLFMIFNLYWIMPMQHTLFDTFDLLSVEQEIYRPLAGAPLHDVLRLAGNTSSFANFYSDNVITALGYSLATLMFTVPLALNKDRKFILFVFVWVVIFVFLSMGPNEPFGEFYTNIYESDIGKAFFPNAANKFEYFLMLPYSFLLGAGTIYLIEYFGPKIKNQKFKIMSIGVVASLVVGTCITIASPMIEHKHFDQEGFGYLKPVKIPSYYSDASDWLKENSDGRTLVFPPPIWRVYSNYVWSPYDMGEIIRPALQVPIVYEYTYANEAGTIGQNPILRTMTDYYKEGKLLEISNFLNLLDVEYVLIREDLVQSPFGAMGYYSLPVVHPSTKPIKEFGPLKIFEVKTESDLEQIQTSKSITGIIGNVRDMISVVKLKEFSKGPFYLADNYEQVSDFNGYDYTTWLIKGVSPTASLEFLDEDTLKVTLTKPPLVTQYAVNLYDVTKNADLQTFGIPSSVKPYEAWSTVFSINELNSKNTIKIEEGDKLAIRTDRTISNEVAYLENSTKKIPSLIINQQLREQVEKGQKQIGYLIDDELTIQDIPIPGKYFLIANDDEVGLKLIADDKIEINEKSSKSIFLNKGEYSISVSPELENKYPFILAYGKNNGNTVVNVDVNYIHETEFQIKPHQQEKFVMTLTNGYTKAWVANQDDSELPHLFLNGYANGFLVEDDSSIRITYTPQVLFTIFGIISIVSIVVCIVYVINPFRYKWIMIRGKKLTKP
ncbi:hypothetical protein AAA799B03_00118 [Marine Group I thaumarchaeote SCGC AAA799-B03]|uniref:Alpha-(1->3)-arabinofuranosyltransferase N-terminal GT-C domain-containing protein n=1 Tax=Marine Group I thaumarchaeote SCGC AAA799-B03 TaxID=1502289 RepID=A0A087S914_9ARCH|nr:hypothetical protein AAA799B03_00118 [Marine Group I thaumarchaeote SCGC AAA799-B03]